MKIAIASGKGGTGKTTIAANLASFLSHTGEKVTYCDVDVEEPNGHIFLKPRIDAIEYVALPVPEVNHDLCDGCSLCSRICQFGAIIVMRKKVIIYPELCHSCGGCTMVCPKDALTEVGRVVGVMEKGDADEVRYVAGRLQIGEQSASPLIRKVKAALPKDVISIIDAPPGTSCSMIEAVRDSDFIILVTEPTPFGLHDLKLAVAAVRELQIPFGVFINRYGLGDDGLEKYCTTEGIEVIGRLPYSREVAEFYSNGELLVDDEKEYQHYFADLAEVLQTELIPGEQRR